MVTSAKQRRNPRSEPPNGLNTEITKSEFPISFHPDWQINDGFFKETKNGAYSNPGTQVVRCLADGLNQSLVSSVAQTNEGLAFSLEQV